MLMVADGTFSIRRCKRCGKIYYDNSLKSNFILSDWCNSTGTLAATAVTGDGSGLSNLPAAGISTAASTVAGIVTTLDLSSAQDHKITVSGISTVTCKGWIRGRLSYSQNHQLWYYHSWIQHILLIPIRSRSKYAYSRWCNQSDFIHGK